MSFCEIEVPDYLKSGTRARLIPVIADTSKEGRICSAFMASFMVVKDYATDLMGSLGVKVNKTSKITCFTEVVIKSQSESKIRPDGLIIITTGNKIWRAIIESKIGKAEVDKEQVEKYLDLARELNIDAVITISNQFTTNPSHCPVNVSGNKTRSVCLFHWSWAYLMSEAVMRVKYNSITNPEQAFILEELVRYLEHDSSGINSIDRVNPEWKEVSTSIQNRITLGRNSQPVIRSVSTWHQLIQSLSLKLSLVIGRSVSVHISKAQRDDFTRIHDDSERLVNDKNLECSFEVPDAASKIKLIADFETRSIRCSMTLYAPKDKATAKGRISWITNQLKKASNPDVIIKAIWPGRVGDTYTELGKLRFDDLKSILPDERKDIVPTAFEVVLSKDLGAKFGGQKTFVDEVQPLIIDFYTEVGQHLKEWIPSAPKIVTKEDLLGIPDELELKTPEQEEVYQIKNNQVVELNESYSQESKTAV